MDEYYDSDDDVCWGPYSKREFLRDVFQPRNIDSRNSISYDPRFSYNIDEHGESSINLSSSNQFECVIESNKFIEKISQILNNKEEHLNSKEEVLNCSDCSEHFEKLDTNEAHENDQIPSEYNIKLSNKKVLEDSNVYFSSSDITESEKPEDSSFVTCSSVSKIIDDNFDDIVNVNMYSDSHATSDAEAAANISANSFYKKNEDSRDYKMSEIQVETDSEESDVSFKFNDTLEDIDRLLNEEVDISTNSKFSSDAEQEIKLHNTLNSPNISMTSIPSKSKLTRAIPTQSSCRTKNEFKIPETPVRTKFDFPMYSKDRFKNIKSPVAVYIKNAPATPLYKKLTPKKCKQRQICESTTSSFEKQNKENVEFPEVIYRKAKHTVTSTQNPFKLPNNIKSLLSGQDVVIKHVEKIEGKKYSISRRLLEDDLTINTTTDESSLHNASQNLSVYESKHAFI